MYKYIIRPILFKFDPEILHNIFLRIGSFLGKYKFTKFLTKKIFYYKSEKLRQNICGIEFENPIGLAAGFDKDGDIIDITKEIGFGFTEIGTVTFHSYVGNKKPRLIRIPEMKSIIVNYGLKNIGVKSILENIKRRKNKFFPLGISIGKTNSESTNTNIKGMEDYKSCLGEVVKSGLGDFFVINISCPNLFGGNPFTNPVDLDFLLSNLIKTKTEKPIFLKIPINLSWEELKELLDLSLKYKIDGVVIGNLNKNKSEVDLLKGTVGSLSGLPCKKLSNDLISKTYKYCGDELKIIGVGGIFSPEDAYEKIKLGASLIQLITGMIYDGPYLIKKINRGIVKLMKEDGFEKIEDVIGVKHDVLK